MDFAAVESAERGVCVCLCVRARACVCACVWGGVPSVAE